MNTSHVHLPDMGRSYGNNVRTIASNACLFLGVRQTTTKWAPAEPSNVYKAASRLLKQRITQRAELAKLQIRLARLHAQIEGAK